MKKLFIAFLAMVSAVGNVFSQSKVISGGNDHGILICAEGYIYAWGSNFSSIGAGPLLGIDPDFPGTTPNEKIIYKPQRVKTSGITFSMVTAGSGAANIALSCKSIVYAWGDNQNKECGQGKNAGNVVEYPVPVLKGETPGYTEDGQKGGDYLGDVVYIAANTQAAFAILGTGEVVGWGTGAWSNGSGEPMYIKTPDNKRLQNVVHVAGGDANCTFRTADGKLYSIGTNNGNDNSDAEYAIPVLEDETGEELSNIRMSGLADKSGFAVQAGTGYVYSWGDGGWGGQTGQGKTMTSVNAGKVIAGEYGTISNEEYLTNVKEIVGGRGSAAAVTEDGYLLYWGCNDENGGVVPDPDVKGGVDANKGPVFAYYCQPGTTKKGKLVDNAVHVSRGDNFFFLYDDENHFYSWGMNDIGQCGVGMGESKYTCLTQIEDIPCEIQDECPNVFLVNQRKCPGEEIELNTSFVVAKNKEHSYYFEWYFDGEKLNSSTIKKSASGKYIYDSSYDDDPFNKTYINISKPGTYKVIAYYIGGNRPCDSCEPQEAISVVTDMDMPIDTTITQSCIMKNFETRPTSNDDISFLAEVNDKFYNSNQQTSWAVFSTADSKDTLDKITVNGAGGVIDFTVTGEKIADSEIHENITDPDPQKRDTTYTIWIEDITQFNTVLLESKIPDAASCSGNYYGEFTQIINLPTSSELKSFSVFATGTQIQPGTISITPIIMLAGVEENGGYKFGKTYWTGKKQTFELTSDDGVQELVIKCNIELPANSARGTRYVLKADISMNNCGYYVSKIGSDATQPVGIFYPNPFEDTEGYGITAIGSTANTGGNPNRDNPFWNITFGKMTDYDCGRIMLTSRYYCPPCDDPKKLEIIASETIKDDVDAKYKKVVELCKESDDLVLNIEPLEGKNDPTAKFDIFWFDKFKADEADALIKDITGSATTLETKTNWATVAGATDITKDAEKVYYVMVYDHKNPESCEHYDSIKVIAHPAPVDSLDWIEFCEGELTAEPTFEIAGKTINWINEPKDVSTLTGPTGTGTKEYTYKYTVTDDETGCEGEEHTLTISVNKTGEPKVISPYPLLKDPSVKFQLSVAAPNVDPDCEIRWYESETATSEMTNTSITLDEAKTIEVWAEQYNKETGCTSVRVKVEIVINDAPMPEVTNESLCIDDEIPNLSEYVKVKDKKHTLNWYDDLSAAKGTGSEQAPSFKATAAGTYKFYVSQTNTDTQAESEKATLTITVHEVATLDLAKNKLTYCINESAEELTFSANNDGDFTTATWSKKSDMSDAVATLSPATDEKGEVTYYVQAKYTNTDAQKHYAKAACPGKIQEITITTNKTDIPNSETNYTVQYLKAEGEKNKSYKSLLDQDGTAVKVEAGHSLKWYDENKNPLSSEPKPEYIENETEGERRVTYFVSQVNQTTGCESELHEVTAIISSFPAPEVKAITLCEGSEKLKSSFPLTAQKSTKGGFAESDYELIWYKKDPKTNPSAEEFKTIDLNLEDLSYDATTETEKDFKYWVVQRYTGPGGGQSPAAELLVSIYSKPILLSHDPDPICLGGEVDLKDLYQISNRIPNKDLVYENEYFGTTGDIVKTSKATEHGEYRSRAWFTLSSGEVCASTFQRVNVTVQELEVAITGDNTTCPGIGVELTAALNPVNMGANDVPSYSWNVSPTGVTGQMETLNTSAEGLSKKGDKLTVNLEVSMGACKGKKPSNAYIVTVDDPGVDGTIKFDEQYNTNSGQGTYTLSKNGIIEFDGCNSKVDVLFNVKQTEDEFTYENLETGDVKKGTFNNGEGNFDIKAGLYEVSYTNTCKTSFKFKVNDRSLDISGSPSSMSVCEGTPLTIKIVSNDNTPFEFDPRKYKIEWQKDGDKLSGYDTDVLYIPSTTPDDNGVYSYTVTSSGCVYHDKIAMGGSFTSKPKVKINESLLAKDHVYEVVRGSEKEITIPIIRSTGIDMSKLDDKIVWYEDEIKDENIVNKGETLSIQSVESDHEYQIVIARGENGYDTEFCGTSVDITLKADALLTIDVTLVDGEGKQTKDMCLNEEGVGFQIDTTGTGTVLHPDSLEFKVVETIDGVKKDINWVKKDNYLFAEISPNKSAKYDIVYKYRIGKQDKSVASEITVHPAYEVDWDRDVRICEGGTGFIQITKAEPASEIVLTWESDECLINGSKNGANVQAVYSGSDLIAKKALTLVASNGGICADKKYYPEFTIDKAITGNIVAPEFVCEGHIATLDASSFKATEYIWTSLDQLGEGVTMTGASINVVSKAGYASYTVEMKRGACTETSDATIEVRYAPKFDRIDSLSFRSIEIILQSNTGTAPFQYIVDDKYDENVNEPIKDNLDYGNHSIKIIDAAGCQIDSSFVTNAPGLDFPNHISPNGDGNNDAFSIPVLRDAYPDANIRIYDRWGKKLAEYKAGNAEMDWDGTYNGVQMPSTDYWYEIEIKEIKKTYTGHFTLIRQ